MASISTDIEHLAFDRLKHFLELHGFEALPALKQYRRDTRTGFQNVMISAAGEGPYSLEFHLGIRSDLVEDLTYQFLGSPAGFAPHATTLSVPLFRLDGTIPRRFFLDGPDEVADACEQALEVLRTTGLQFFEDHNTIQDLDELLNHKPTENNPYLYNQTHRCFRGLVVAKMANNKGFSTLMETYHDRLMEQSVPVKLQMGFERLSVLLHNFSLN